MAGETRRSIWSSPPPRRPCARRWRCWRAPPLPMPRCCCAARTAPARACWLAPSTQEPARRGTVRGGQLPDPLRGASGDRAVRPRQGRLHRGGARPGRAGGGGRRRNPVPRRESARISPGLQAKLLRFLQEKQFERVGEKSHTGTPTCGWWRRAIAISTADVAAGRFREDLFYRLNVVELPVPPLRERTAEILPLARRFLAQAAREAHRPSPISRPRASSSSSPTPGRATCAS